MPGSIDLHLAGAAEGEPLGLRLAPHLEAYLTDIRACAAQGGGLASVVLFGSTATGGYSAEVSDVDLLLVMRDDADAEDRRRLGDVVPEIEVRHGLAKPCRRGVLEGFADCVTANVRSFIVCTRADLLSGDPVRIFDIPPWQARFADRAAIPSVLSSGVTLWGEDLL